MKILLVLSFLCIVVSAQPKMENISIIPEPQSAAARPGHFKLNSSTKIIVATGSATEQFIAQVLNDELAIRRDMTLKVTEGKSVRKLSANFIFIGTPASELGKRFVKERKAELTKEMKMEGYFLDVDAKGIVILAESEKGLFYGVTTLLQMVKYEGRSVTVQNGTVSDFPLQKIRGITDDISRGQISTMENFRKIIRYCAMNKLNVYMPYIEDVFLFKNHPVLGKERGALTAAEWKELDAYAKKYFVEMIPIFETLGHWENILINPDYVKYAEFPGAHTVNVSDENVYALLDEMIGEMAPCFSSPYFHMAADESWDVGLGVNKQRVAASDLAAVHADHYKRIFSIIKKHGKKPVMYGDIILNHPGILALIPNDVLIVDWQYGGRFDFGSPEVFKNAGFPFLVSPAVWNFTGPFPNYLNTFLNIYYLNLDGYKNGSMGMVCSNWNDFGGEALRELNYYGYAWTSECAWNPMKANTTQFDKKFFDTFFDAEQDEVRAVYSMLTNPANQFHWYEIWRHPMLPNRDNMIWEVRLPLVQRMQSINSTMPYALALLEEAEKEITVNKEHLRYLGFVARMNLWFAQKIEAQEKIRIIIKDSTLADAEKISSITAMSTEVVTGLMKVKEEFSKLWITTNKPNGLDLLLQRYDRQAAYWNELIDRVSDGDFAVDPTLPSQWIYHPNGSSGRKDTVQTPRAFFRREIGPVSNVKSASVQLLGDSWSKLYVNGKVVGEVLARRSLSLLVETQRAKIFDIKPFLTDSANVIAVEAQNFQEKGSAGMNVYGEIALNDGSVQSIMSDSSWQVTDTVSAEWNTGRVNAGSWLQAVPKKYSVPVVKPNLATGRTSWFER